MTFQEELAALQAEVRACRLCAYGHPVRPAVETCAGARLMLIGQAPGKQENELGRPWMGAAGRRLMSWMTQSVGFASEEAFRESVYLAAMTRCFPGPHPSGRGDRKPSPAEMANCRPFMERELALLRPEIVLLVGGLAIEAFMGKVKLDEVIGRAYEAEFGGFSTRLLPLPHPSGASTWLNQAENKARLEEALRLLRRLIREGDLAPLR